MVNILIRNYQTLYFSRIDLDKRILEADAFVPKTTMEADYVMDGRFLVLPVKGKGKCKFDFSK
jgi:hypothetical protein